MRPGIVRPIMLAIVIATPFAATRAQQQKPGPWAVALGVNSAELNPATERPGTRVEFVGSVSRYWNLWSGVDLRVQTIAGAQLPRALTLNGANGCTDCEVWTSRQFAAVSTALTYEWRQGEAFRPYVLGGGGVVFAHSRQRLEAPCVASGSCTPVLSPGMETRVIRQGTFGYTVGTGVAFRLGKADMFAEYARNRMRPGATPVTPLSIGIRF
jgi:hypothetical protein